MPTVAQSDEGSKTYVKKSAEVFLKGNSFCRVPLTSRASWSELFKQNTVVPNPEPSPGRNRQAHEA